MSWYSWKTGRDAELDALVEGAAFRRNDKGAYIRERGEALHLIAVQRSQMYPIFYVNIGFSYGFLMGALPERPADWHSLDLLDCVFRGRLDTALLIGRAAEYPWSKDFRVLSGTLKQAFREAVSVLDQWDERWNDPNVLVERIPPEAFETEAKFAGAGDNLSKPDPQRHPFYAAINPMHAAMYNLQFALAMVAARRGERDTAIRYLDLLDTPDLLWTALRPYIRRFRARLKRTE